MLQGSPGAAVALLEHLYEKLTKKRYVGQCFLSLLSVKSAQNIIVPDVVYRSCHPPSWLHLKVPQHSIGLQVPSLVQQQVSNFPELRQSMQTHWLATASWMQALSVAFTFANCATLRSQDSNANCCCHKSNHRLTLPNCKQPNIRKSLI